MTVTETWATPDAIVEVHDTPPEGYEGDGTHLGHLQATNALASVTIPVSKALLDDDSLKDYVKTRLSLFLRLEMDRVKAEGCSRS